MTFQTIIESQKCLFLNIKETGNKFGLTHLCLLYSTNFHDLRFN